MIGQVGEQEPDCILLNLIINTKYIVPNSMHCSVLQSCFTWKLGPSINGLVTGGNTKLCCRGFILALFQSTTANKIDSEHLRDYKRLLPVCEAEILRVTVK